MEKAVTVLDTKMIKSAQRVLEVLEYFDADHPYATVMDVSRRLGYPQSSTSELLRCLVSLGYLSYDRYKRFYEPTARVALLGAWVQPALFRKGYLLPILDELSKSTGCAVTLSAVVGLEVQHIHVVPSREGAHLQVAQGGARPMLHSSVGRIFLASFSEMRIRALVHRLNAEEEQPERRVRLADLQAELKVVRQRGYAAEAGEYLDDVGGVHMLLPHRDGQLLSLGVVAAPAAISLDKDHYVSLLRAAIRRDLGPDTAAGVKPTLDSRAYVAQPLAAIS